MGDTTTSNISNPNPSVQKFDDNLPGINFPLANSAFCCMFDSATSRGTSPAKRTTVTLFDIVVLIISVSFSE